jgi:hypothetical protein
LIRPEQHAEIRRLCYGEHWKVGTIAAALGVHHETVRAALVNDTQGMRHMPPDAARSVSAAGPRHRRAVSPPACHAALRDGEGTRLHGIGRAAAALVRLIRPPATATVYRRLTTLAGEEAQVDWGASARLRSTTYSVLAREGL